MKEKTQTRRPIGVRNASTHPVKLTALIYLKEVLLAERYEECSELIQAALEFGAQGFEIASLLEDPRREVT